MNEEMESELTKADSIPDNVAVSEYASVDESVPIEIRKERNTKSYKETMSKDIENIYTTECRPIYEVINKAYTEYSKISPDDFIRECKNNSNKAQFIPREVKNSMNLMEME